MLKNFVKETLRPLAEKKAIQHCKQLTTLNNISANDPKTIIFNRVYTRFSISFFHELTIAKTLQQLGHNVIFLICNHNLRLCTSFFSIKKEDENKICQNCSDFGKNILSALNIPFQEFHKPSTTHTHNKYDKSINASVDRYFKGITNRNKEDVEFIKNIKNRNATIVYNTAKQVYDKYKPDVVFSAHYGYIEWNPLYEYMKQKNVRYIVWDYSYGQKIVFDLENLGERFNKIKQYITDDDRKQAREYIQKRKNKQADTKKYNYNTSKKLDTGKYKKTFCMFPNLSWDTSLLNSHTVFSSMYKWVDDTIEFFKKQPDYQLFIKVHPAEETDGSYETIADYIRNNHVLTSNIQIIDNNSGIGAYAVYDAVDVGIVYNGTAGIEMSCQGKPVILVGDIFYHTKGFTYDAVNKEHYHSLINNVDGLLDKEQITCAESFAYFYMIHSSIPMDFVINTKMGSRFNIKSFNNLLKNNNMKKIIRYILRGEYYNETKKQ